jgi:hypothetical protein
MLIVKDLTLPLKDRSRLDYGNLAKKLSDAHCFDITAIYEDAYELGREAFSRGEFATEQTFIPAEKTWIEYRIDEGNRYGCLLEQTGTDEIICWPALTAKSGDWSSYPDPFAVNLKWQGKLEEGNWPVKYSMSTLGKALEGRGYIKPQNMACLLGITLVGSLAFINSPRIIGRRQHHPHRGLERELLKHQKSIGRFPLHAWTEIVLDVSPPKEAKGEHDYEAHLTGKRALHFVRAHLRIRDGKLQFVKSHWRGDAALGIKQSRYTVKKRAA